MTKNKGKCLPTIVTVFPFLRDFSIHRNHRYPTSLLRASCTVFSGAVTSER